MADHEERLIEKLRLSVEIDLYNQSRLAGFQEALMRLVEMAGYLQSLNLSDKELEELPTGAMHGAPHTLEKLGWKGFASFGFSESDVEGAMGIGLYAHGMGQKDGWDTCKKEVLKKALNHESLAVMEFGEGLAKDLNFPGEE